MDFLNLSALDMGTLTAWTRASGLTAIAFILGFMASTHLQLGRLPTGRALTQLVILPLLLLGTSCVALWTASQAHAPLAGTGTALLLASLLTAYAGVGYAWDGRRMALAQVRHPVIALYGPSSELAGRLLSEFQHQHPGVMQVLALGAAGSLPSEGGAFPSPVLAVTDLRYGASNDGHGPEEPALTDALATLQARLRESPDRQLVLVVDRPEDLEALAVDFDRPLRFVGVFPDAPVELTLAGRYTVRQPAYRQALPQ